MNWFLYYLVGCSVIWISTAFVICVVGMRPEIANRERLANFLTGSESAATGRNHETFFAFLDIAFAISFGSRQGRKACVSAAISMILLALYVGIFSLLFPPKVGNSSATLYLYREAFSFGITYAPISAFVMGLFLFGSFFASTWVSILKTRAIVRAIVSLRAFWLVPGFIVLDFFLSASISVLHLSLLAVFIAGPHLVSLYVMTIPTYGNMMGLLLGRWQMDGPPYDLVFACPFISSAWLTLVVSASAAIRFILSGENGTNFSRFKRVAVNKPIAAVSIMAFFLIAAGLAAVALLNFLVPGELIS